MFALSTLSTCIPIALVSVPSKSTRNKASKPCVVHATQVSDYESTVIQSTVPRRTALAVALGVCVTPSSVLPAYAAPNANALFSIADSETSDTKLFEFKTYRLAVPTVYEEVNVPLKDPATGVVSPTVLLLKDNRAGQAGNTVSVSKQVVPEGGITTVADIGTAAETAARLVQAESQRSTGQFGKAFGGNGGSGALRASSQRIDRNSQLYYTAAYTKSVLGVSRVVLSTLVVADGTLYTFTAEEDEGRFDGEMGRRLRSAADSFEVIPQGGDVAAAPAQAAQKKKGRK